MSRLIQVLTSMTMVLLVVRFGGAGAGFLTQLVLARLLAPESLGLFFAAASLAAVASTVVAFGYPAIAPRFISRYQARARTDILAGFVRQTHRDVLVLSVVVCGVILAAALIWPGASERGRQIFVLTAICLPILAFLEINSWIALSLRSFFLAYGPESFLSPVLFLIIISGMVVAGLSPDVLIVLSVFFTVSGLLAIGQWLLLRPALPFRPSLLINLPGDNNAVERVDGRLAARWRREGIPQIAVGIFTLLFADLAILLAATVLDAASLAAFAIALKLAMLVGFAVQVAHQVIIPDLADAHAARKLRQTGETMRAAAALPVAFTLSALIGAILFGDYALAIFHPDFAMAQGVLVLLIGCQLLRALAGPVVQLLTIAGAQMLIAVLCIASTAVLALANLTLVPSLGMMGAGYAVLATWLFWLSTSAIALYRMTGLRCDILFLSGFVCARKGQHKG